MNWRSVKPLVFETEIEEFELKIKYKFPTSFKKLIQLYNGGKPSELTADSFTEFIDILKKIK